MAGSGAIKSILCKQSRKGHFWAPLDEPRMLRSRNGRETQKKFFRAFTANTPGARNFHVRTPCTTQSGHALADSSPIAHSVARTTPVLAKPSATMASEDADHCPRPHANQSASMHCQAKNEARASALFCDAKSVLLWCARDTMLARATPDRMLRASNGGREPGREAAWSGVRLQRVPVVSGFSARIPACKRLICMGLAQTHAM